MTRINRRLATTFVLCAAAMPAMAQQDYPNHVVKIIVPYGPATGIDLAARILADRLTKTMGQSFVIDNKAGAAGVIGIAAAAAATPDGYTLLMNATSQTTLPALKTLPYDAKNGFANVAMLASSPLVLVTSRSKGYKTVKDLVSAAKANPGKLTFASAGVGTSTHMASEKFRLAAGFEALHIPYKSTTDALAEVMSGRIDYLVTTLPSALGPVKDGRMVALAMGRHRHPSMPGVPTLAEAGVPNAESDTWFGVFAPAKTPKAILTRLHAETLKAVDDPEVKERLAKIGAEPVKMSMEDFDAQVRREIADHEKIVKTLGLKVE